MTLILCLLVLLSYAVAFEYHDNYDPYIPGGSGSERGVCSDDAPCILGKCEMNRIPDTYEGLTVHVVPICVCHSDTDCKEGRCMYDMKDMEGEDIYTCRNDMGSCEDFSKNGAETDIDCGGPMCIPCSSSQKCLTDSDCASGTCQTFLGEMRCIGCSDGVLNGNESDIDCGGDCEPCGVDKKCNQYILENDANDAKLYEMSGQASQYDLDATVKIARKISHGHCKLWYAEGTNNTWKKDALRDRLRIARKVAHHRQDNGLQFALYDEYCPAWTDSKCAMRDGSTVYGVQLSQDQSLQSSNTSERCAERSMMFLTGNEEDPDNLGNCITSNYIHFDNISYSECIDKQLGVNNFVDTICMVDNQEEFGRLEHECASQITFDNYGGVSIPDLDCFMDRYVGEDPGEELDKVVSILFPYMLDFPTESLPFKPNEIMNSTECAVHCKTKYNSVMFYMAGDYCGCCDPLSDQWNDSLDDRWQESDYVVVSESLTGSLWYDFPNGKFTDYSLYYTALVDMPRYNATCKKFSFGRSQPMTDTDCREYCQENHQGTNSRNDLACECIKDIKQENLAERPHYSKLYELEVYEQNCLDHCEARYPNVSVEVTYIDSVCSCREVHKTQFAISEQLCYDSCQNPTEWTDMSCRTGTTEVSGISSSDCSSLGPGVYDDPSRKCTFQDGSFIISYADICYRCHLPGGSVSTTLSNADCEFLHNGWVETGSFSTDPSTCKLLDNSIIYGLSSYDCSQHFSWTPSRCEFSNGVYTSGLTKSQCDEKRSEDVTFFIEQNECHCCAKYDCEDTCSKSDFNQYTCRSCSDGVKNGGETDIDCGGDPDTGCGKCTGSMACKLDEDCAIGNCISNLCIDCGDGVKNGDETDVDCGGSCTGCPVGNGCESDSDCGGYCSQYCELNSVKFYDITESDCTSSYTPSRCYIKYADGSINVLWTGGTESGCSGYHYDESICVSNGVTSYNVNADNCIAVFHKTCQDCNDGIKGPSEPETDKGKYCTLVDLYGECYEDEDCLSGICVSPLWSDSGCILHNGTVDHEISVWDCAEMRLTFVSDDEPPTRNSYGDCFLSDGTIVRDIELRVCEDRQEDMDNFFIHTKCVTGYGNEILEYITKGSCELRPKRCQECSEDNQCSFKCHNGHCISNTPGQYMGTDCPAGSYDDDSDVETKCVLCPAGYSSNAGGVGLRSCTLCGDGQQSVAGGLCVDLSCDIYGALPAAPVCHGECSVENGEYTCTDCTGKWYGPKCQYHADCDPGQVFNGTACDPCDVWSYGNMYCTDGSPCVDSPCNGGKCLDVYQQLGEDTWNQQMGEYTWKCLCPSGKYGDLCQYNGYSHFENVDTSECKDEYYGDKCQFSYECSSGSDLRVGGCIPKCKEKTKSDIYTCMCGDSLLEGEFCIDDKSYSICSTGAKDCYMPICHLDTFIDQHSCMCGNELLGANFPYSAENKFRCKTWNGVHYYTPMCTASITPAISSDCINTDWWCTHNCHANGNIIDFYSKNKPVNNFISGCTTEDHANTNLNAHYTETCVSKIKTCTANANCEADEVCKNGLCRDNFCIESYYDINTGKCTRHSHCEVGYGSNELTFHEDSDCVSCANGTYNEGNSSTCTQWRTCDNEIEIEYIGDAETDTLCIAKQDCKIGTYQFGDGCVQCDGYVPQPGVCVPFTNCSVDSYLSLPIGWDGTSDGTCETRKTCASGTTPLISSDVTDDTFCVLDTLDNCTHPAVEYSDISHDDRQLLFYGKLGMNNAIIPLLLCDGKILQFTVQNRTDPVVVSNNIATTGFFAYNFSASVEGVCSKTSTLADCVSVYINDVIFDSCLTEFEECDCSGCIHGICSNESVCECTNIPNSQVPATGDHCEKVPDCTQCVNGECEIDMRYCNCDSGWTGIRCSTSYDDCSVGSSPCGKAGDYGLGTCIDGHLNYTCDCIEFAEKIIPTEDTGFEYCAYKCMDYCVHGYCIEERTTNTRQCVCNAGYRGLNCDEEIPDCECSPMQRCVIQNGTSVCQYGCDTEPCVHGVCSNRTGGDFTCNCTAGYEGETCGEEINECDPNLCENNSTCIDQVNGFSCACGGGFTGTLCGINVCDTKHCNNGTCSAGECICISGYTGELCLHDVNECGNEPCGVGNCSNTVGSYTCDCPSGFVEADGTCNNVNECTDIPCGTGEGAGVCNDTPGSYTCDCPSGFVEAGGTCENFNDCTENACNNHGTCTDGVNDYTCDCIDGWKGTECDINEFPCNDVTCNNGACIPNVTTHSSSYFCSCNNGWTGPDCLADFDSCEPNPCGVFDCDDQGPTSQEPYICICPDDMAFHDGECVCGLGNGLDTNYPSTQTVQYNGQTFEACVGGPVITVDKQGGLHNVYEGEAPVYETLSTDNFDDTDGLLNALPGQTRSFYCSEHPTLTFKVKCTPSCETCSMPNFNMDHDLSPCEKQKCDSGYGIIDAGFNNSNNISNCEQCATGYESDGTHECRDVNECLDSPCGLYGSCNDIDGSYECICDDGYYDIQVGSDGNIAIFCILNDACHTLNPCQNGLCNNFENEYGYTCGCDAGWTGRVCDESVNDCVNPDCNYGSCIDAHQGYTCNCTGTGFEGDNCEINIYDCEYDSCNHRGECQDQIKGFSCDCYGRWGGDTCLENSPINKTCPDGYVRQNQICVVDTQTFVSGSADPRNGHESGTERANFNIRETLKGLAESNTRGSGCRREYGLRLTKDDLSVATKNLINSVINRNISKVFITMAWQNAAESYDNTNDCHLDFDCAEEDEFMVLDIQDDVGSWGVVCEGTSFQCLQKRTQTGYTLHQWTDSFDSGTEVSAGDIVACGRNTVRIGSIEGVCIVDQDCVNAVSCEPSGNSFQCVCGDGHYLNGDECVIFSDCDSTEYQKSAPTTTSDRICEPITYCNYTTHYRTALATDVSDTKCAEITYCGESQYTSAEANETTNTQCAEITSCTVTQYESVAPTSSSDRQCVDLTECTTTQYETEAPTLTSDRQCTDLTICTEGYFESISPTATSDRACEAKNCTSTHVISDDGQYGKYYCRHGVISGTTGNCSCSCVGGFTGTNCDLCAAGYGVEDNICAECEYPEANSVTSYESPCANQTCIEGWGVVKDGFNTSSDSSENCEECDIGEASPPGSGVCQLDSDGDGDPDANDDDDDNDGVPDVDDDFPIDPSKHTATVCNINQYETVQIQPTIDRECDDLSVCTESQYESVAPTSTSDRQCADLTVCSVTQYQSVAPTSTSDRQCTDLTVCTVSQYQSVAPASTSDRQCTDLTVCTASQYETEAHTATSDRQCTDLTVCTTSQYQSVAPTSTSDRQCTNLTVCTISQYQSATPTSTSDRECTDLTVCTASQYETEAHTATSNRQCTNLTVCTELQYESEAHSTTSDRQCSDLAVCTVSQYQSVAPTSTSDRQCTDLTVCIEGYYESDPPTTTSDRICETLNSICNDSQYESVTPDATTNRQCTDLTVCTASQ